MFSGRTGPSTSLSARPCAAPPRPASNRTWYVQNFGMDSNRDKFFNAQANAKHQSSNNIAKELVQRIAVVLVKAFVLPRRRSGQCSRFAGGQAGGVVSWPNRPNGVSSYPSPAPPSRPAVRRPEPTGPWCVQVLDSTGSAANRIPGMRGNRETRFLSSQKCVGSELCSRRLSAV